ncbi:MAG: hypothetical protein ACRC62_25820 [Microcoleus sp.]
MAADVAADAADWLLRLCQGRSKRVAADVAADVADWLLRLCRGRSRMKSLLKYQILTIKSWLFRIDS